MADDSDYAHTPPTQANAYGPSLTGEEKQWAGGSPNRLRWLDSMQAGQRKASTDMAVGSSDEGSPMTDQARGGRGS